MLVFRHEQTGVGGYPPKIPKSGPLAASAPHFTSPLAEGSITLPHLPFVAAELSVLVTWLSDGLPKTILYFLLR